MPSKFNYEDFKDGVVQSLVAVTPNDSTDLPGGPARGFLIGGTTGAVSFDTANGETVTLAALPVNTVFWFAVKRIRSTGTIATGILACY